MENKHACKICGKRFEKVLSLNAHIGFHSQKHIDKKEEKTRLYKEHNDIIFDLFLDNKYTRIYYSLIKSARQKDYNGMYTEKHHIIPKSLGGSDEWTNLVKLSPKEHFICHYLLTKMLKKKTSELNSMYSAFMLMRGGNLCHNNSRYHNSRLYNHIKNEYSISKSISMIGKNNPSYGTKWITNFKTKSIKKVKKESLSSYLELGWKLGKIENFDLYDNHGNKIKHCSNILGDRITSTYIYFNNKRYKNNLINSLRFKNNLSLDCPEKLNKTTLYTMMKINLSNIGFNFLAENMFDEYNRIKQIMTHCRNNLTYNEVKNKFNINNDRSITILYKLFDIL